ncbi:Mitogen-activated protein kinase kinase 1-interacting protein 1 [Aphelenchoides avenae]|nr:Mitogen-activated protein kinase kinase 1-interacting protein 1 [Aphelenchus avenae]
MVLKISESLERLVKLTPDVQSILITDQDGVPMVTAGDEIRNRGQLTAAYTSSVEQAKKLDLGAQKAWTFLYETQQLVILSLTPFVVFILASPAANTGYLCNLGPELKPILQECQPIYDAVAKPMT